MIGYTYILYASTLRAVSFVFVTILGADGQTNSEAEAAWRLQVPHSARNEFRIQVDFASSKPAEYCE